MSEKEKGEKVLYLFTLVPFYLFTIPGIPGSLLDTRLLSRHDAELHATVLRAAFLGVVGDRRLFHAIAGRAKSR